MSNESNPLNLPQHILDMSAEVKKTFKADDHGVIPPDRDTWKKLLAHSQGDVKVTEDEVKRVQQFEQDVNTALNNAVGEFGLTALKKNKDLEKVSLKKFNVGKNAASIDFIREHKGVKGFGSNAEPVTHYGHLDAEYKTSVGSTNTVHHKAMRDHFHTLGAELFEK